MVNSILNFERLHLDDTREWIDKEIIEIRRQEKRLLFRIGELEKEARGSYNEELETTKALYKIVRKNLENYSDSKERPYFARIDFKEHIRDIETFYIGKFGIGDFEKGEEIVIDWRAPIADLYYSGTKGEVYYRSPIGLISGNLELKRKFLYKENTIDEYFDEGINEIILRNENNENALIDEFLKINLEQNTGSKLKEVIATIQKEQNEIIRANKNYPIIVQGSAGSGKTTIALHRLAYLLYRYKEKMTGRDVLVLAPNKLFLDYISEILPDLGVEAAFQSTFDDFIKKIMNIKGKIYTKDMKLKCILEDNTEKEVITSASRLRGTKAFMMLLDKYIEIIDSHGGEIENIYIDGYLLFKNDEIKRLYLNDLTHLAINSRKDEIKRYLLLKYDEALGNILKKIDFKYDYMVARVKKECEDINEKRKKLTEIYDERDEIKKRIKKSGIKQFDEYFEKWKNINTKNMYIDMYDNMELHEYVKQNNIEDSLWQYIKIKAAENGKNDIIDSDDLAAMMYLHIKVYGIPDNYKYSHIVIDEAQDYSMLQIYIARLFSRGNSMTIVGDTGQGIYSHKGINDWREAINQIFNEECTYIQLSQSYRSTIEIIELANKVLSKQNNSLKPASPVLRRGDKPGIISYDGTLSLINNIDEIVIKMNENNRKSIAIICKSLKGCKVMHEKLRKYSKYKWNLVKEADKTIDMQKVIVPVYLTKGLEFDCTIIIDCDNDNYKEDEEDKKLLYVALTRALHYEYIFYKNNLTKLLK